MCVTGLSCYWLFIYLVVAWWDKENLYLKCPTDLKLTVHNTMLSRPTIQKWVQSWFLAENLCQTKADTGSAGTRPSGLAWRLLSITFHNKTLAQVSLALMILGTQTVTFLNTYSHDSVRYQTAICHSFSYFHTHFSWSWHTSAIITIAIAHNVPKGCG